MSYLFIFPRSKHHECCVDSPTPDDSTFRYLAQTYAKHHPVMKDGNEVRKFIDFVCLKLNLFCFQCNETFPNGITNGAYWYDLSNGMQDYVGIK